MFYSIVLTALLAGQVRHWPTAEVPDCPRSDVAVNLFIGMTISDHEFSQYYNIVSEVRSELEANGFRIAAQEFAMILTDRFRPPDKGSNNLTEWCPPTLITANGKHFISRPFVGEENNPKIRPFRWFGWNDDGILAYTIKPDGSLSADISMKGSPGYHIFIRHIVDHLYLVMRADMESARPCAVGL